MGGRVVVTLGSRTEAIERLAQTTSDDPLDVLVVGGGITGAGIALDAAARGMRVGLVERFDVASGTSSKSSKLVHGGLRYLEQREFGLIREASTERDLLRRLAPHLVEPVPFTLPVSDRWNRAKFSVGLWAYDTLASFKNMKVHRHLDAEETERRVPLLPHGKVKGGYLFYDCKTDDVRLVMENLIQARRYGAIVANYLPVRGLEPGKEVCRATVEDTETTATFDIYARRVIVAAGVWTDRVEGLAAVGAPVRLRPSKGIHIAFRHESLPMDGSAAFIPDAERKRFLFVIPWIDGVIVGTTDTAYEGNLDAPTVEPEDREYCLAAVNAVFDLGLTETDIAGAWAGLRPLVAADKGATADLSRRHTVYDIADGIIGITGGKLTTFRRMAMDAVDRIAGDLGNTVRSRTQWIRLGSSNVGALNAAVTRRAAVMGINPERASNLVRCYGDRALAVLDLAATEGATAPLIEDHLPLEAEVLYCARSEMAVHLSDFLARRTRLALLDREAGLGDDARAGRAMADVLSWDDMTTATEIEGFKADVERERGMRLGAAPAPSGVTRERAG
ncbi:MAG: glycerol-3-phosphate dehydrogenase [Actinomycetota bacterium]|nr:glycerol-3-phosphate dehydrogenase [Actinomycetota bacterium]